MPKLVPKKKKKKKITAGSLSNVRYVDTAKKPPSSSSKKPSPTKQTFPANMRK